MAPPDDPGDPGLGTSSGEENEALLELPNSSQKAPATWGRLVAGGGVLMIIAVALVVLVLMPRHLTSIGTVSIDSESVFQQKSRTYPHQLATPAPAPAGPKKVDFYFEIGCPVCETLLSGVMQTIASTYADKVNVEFHPWGNSFYGMASCSSDLAPKPESTVNPDPRYTPTARFCWDGKCTCPGQVGTCVTKDKDCFKGNMICQHGPKACDLQGYALCAKKAIGDDWKKMLKFSSCLEKGHEKAGEYKFPTGSIGFIAKDCCKKADLDFATIDACVNGDEVKQLGKAEAEMTPKHHLVPYVEVDGQPLHGIGATPTMLITAIELGA